MHILHCWHTPSHGGDAELPYTVMQLPAMSALWHNKFSRTISLHSLPTLPAWRSPGSKLASQAAIYPHLPIYFTLDIGSMIMRIHNKGTSGFRHTHYSCAWRRRDLAIATLKYAERTNNAPTTSDSTQWNMALMFTDLAKELVIMNHVRTPRAEHAAHTIKSAINCIACTNMLLIYLFVEYSMYQHINDKNKGQTYPLGNNE